MKNNPHPESADTETSVLRSFITHEYPHRLHPSAGNLPYPYIDPAGAHYAHALWDWDAYFCALGLAPWADRIADHTQGCVLNFLAFQGTDGHIPYRLAPDTERLGERAPDTPLNSAKPLLAQFALLGLAYGQAAGRQSYEATDVLDPLARHVAHWEATQQAEDGLFVFRSHRGSGTDNHPAVYGRPYNSSADVFLNTLMVREHHALAHLARLAGDTVRQAEFAAKADKLAAQIRIRLWDPVDGMFYNLEVTRQSAGPVNQVPDWPVPLKFKMWTGFIPLWARIATPEQAHRLVSEHLLVTEEFMTPYGIRSMAANEPAYSNFAGSNPSNWQGPIWVVSNYLVYRGLREYGFDTEAELLANRLRHMLANDVAAHGCLHEYYDPETGVGLTHPGFFNWNTLVELMAPGAGADPDPLPALTNRER